MSYTKSSGRKLNLMKSKSRILQLNENERNSGLTISSKCSFGAELGK